MKLYLGLVSYAAIVVVYRIRDIMTGIKVVDIIPEIQVALVVLNFVVPQLTLFDLSAKCVHADSWRPVEFAPMVLLTAYGLFFAGLYLALALFTFRRRPL